jgi:hypothetical protein
MQLAEIADNYGCPWYTKMGSENGEFAPVAEEWYQNY